MAKKMCIAMVLSKTIKVEDVYVDIEMSKGIVGVMTVYESKKAAREIVGNKIPLYVVKWPGEPQIFEVKP